jgi:glycosyltransferase involved in cell wall biosynthesis
MSRLPQNIKTLFIGPFSPPYNGDGVKNSCLKDGFEAAGLNQITYFDTICRVGNKWIHFLRLLPLMASSKQIILSLNKNGRLVIIWLFFLMRLISMKKGVLYVVGGSFDLQLAQMGKFKRRMYVNAINQLDGVFAESNSLKEGLISVGVKNVEIVYNPRKDNGNKWSLSDDLRGKLVFISRVTETKGVSYLLEAGEKAIAEGLDITIDFYGPVDESYELFFMDRINQSAGRFNYRGLINPSEVQTFLTKYHCLALPTYHHGEGLPGILVEAGMAGTPIIISRFNALPEYFINKESALFVDPHDVDGLKNAIKELVKTDKLSNDISKGIKKLVIPFHLEFVINQSIELLERKGWYLK